MPAGLSLHMSVKQTAKAVNRIFSPEYLRPRHDICNQRIKGAVHSVVNVDVGTCLGNVRQHRRLSAAHHDHRYLNDINQKNYLELLENLDLPVNLLPLLKNYYYNTALKSLLLLLFISCSFQNIGKIITIEYTRIIFLESN